MDQMERSYERTVSLGNEALMKRDIVIRHPKSWLMMGGIAAVVFILGAIFLVTTKNTFDTGLDIELFWGAFGAVLVCFMIALYTVLYTYRWKLVLSDDLLIYTPSFRKTRAYRLDQVDKFEMGEDKFRDAPNILKREFGHMESGHISIDVKIGKKHVVSTTSRDSGFFDFTRRLGIELPDYISDTAFAPTFTPPRPTKKQKPSKDFIIGGKKKSGNN